MAGPGPICARCYDDVWRLSERHWCEKCEATDVPPTAFTPDGDGSKRRRCVDCREMVTDDQAHLVKANNVVGRAHRCEECGQAAHRAIVAYNRVSQHQRKLRQQ